MATVALVPHRRRPEALDVARRAAAWLEQRSHEVRVPGDDAVAGDLRRFACPVDKLTADLDLVVSLGGDGTMLHAVDLVAGSGVPVLGVNIGHLGYLTTEVEPGALPGALERFLAGEHRIEDRMALEVEVRTAGATGMHTCLNEAVLEKTVSGHTIRLAVRVNGKPFHAYSADGLIVATPTGSTAYNLSARGPILSPLLRAIVVTPVSPHSLFAHSVVLGPDDALDVEVMDGRPAALVLDGRDVGPLAPGDAVACRPAPVDARLVTFGDRDFHQILKAKFGLGR
ncbi:MAG TPA: NAD(+)/NADH kinase [Acidimicrobiales bacterium]|nr:NAD(+)/NADH kinase [Acidimicrobiales bacterium]